MKTVCYIRVSSDKTEQQSSMDTQEREFQQWVTQNNHTIAQEVGIWVSKDGSLITQGIYADEGFSALNMKRREAFNTLLRDAKYKPFDCVYVNGISRFARNLGNFVSCVEDLKVLGIRVYFAELHIDSFSIGAELVTTLLAVLAQEESKIRSSSTQRGIRQVQEKGKWNSNAPFGYDIVKGYLQINSQESETVKKVYDWYTNNGWGTQKIARELNASNILTKKGKLWSQIQIMTMVRNPIYIGKQIQRRYRNENILREKRTEKQIKLPESEWKIHEFEHLRIIETELYEFAQKQIEERKSLIAEGTRYSHKYLLSNILICGECGTALRRKKRNGKGKDLGFEWRCSIADRYGKAKCSFNGSMPEDVIIEKVKGHLKTILSDNIIEDYFNQYIESEYKSDYNKEMEIIQESIVKLKNKVKLNFELLSEGIIDKEQYALQNKELQESIKEQEYEYNRLLYIDKEVEGHRKYAIKLRKIIEGLDVDSITNAQLRVIFMNISMEWDDIRDRKQVILKGFLNLNDTY